MTNLSTKSEFNSNERFAVKLPILEGDHQIYLGQMFVTMLRLNRSLAYTDDQNKQFDIELVASVIEELDINLEDIAKELENRKLNH